MDAALPGGGSQSQFGGIDEGLDAELEALLAQDGDEKWGAGSEAREENRDGIQNRGGGWRVPGGGVGMVERSDEGPPIEHEISQAARDAMEDFDLDEEEEGSGPPYTYRPGHVYFPGHSYEIEVRRRPLSVGGGQGGEQAGWGWQGKGHG